MGATRVQVAADTHTSGMYLVPPWVMYGWGRRGQGVVITGHIGHPNGSDLGKEQGVFFFFYSVPPPAHIFLPAGGSGSSLWSFFGGKEGSGGHLYVNSRET